MCIHVPVVVTRWKVIVESDSGPSGKMEDLV